MKYTKRKKNKRTFRKKSINKNTQKHKYIGGSQTNKLPGEEKTITLSEDSIKKILDTIHPNFHRLITKTINLD
jgi:type I restriction-modification system DNA methylase subunit